MDFCGYIQRPHADYWQNPTLRIQSKHVVPETGTPEFAIPAPKKTRKFRRASAGASARTTKMCRFPGGKPAKTDDLSAHTRTNSRSSSVYFCAFYSYLFRWGTPSSSLESSRSLVVDF
jgi:hypothetical protein